MICLLNYPEPISTLNVNLSILLPGKLKSIENLIKLK